MRKFLIGLLLVASTLYADLITTFEFDFDETSLSWTPPNEEGVFYYNLAQIIVDTSGSWRAANSSILSHDSWDYGTSTNGFTEADTYFYVYQNTFDLSDVKKNLFAEDDDGYDGGSGLQFDLTEDLIAGTTYWGVITSYDAEQSISGVVDVYGPTGSSISMVIIPEPAAAGLLLGGATLILLLRKRK